MWMKSIKNIFFKLRESVWPLLDPLEEKEPKLIDEKDCCWDDTDTDLLLKYIEKYCEGEEKRSNQIESKSIIFISTFTVANTLLLSLIKDMIFNGQIAHSIFRLILISVIMLCVIYLCRSIWFSIKALQRRNYSTMGFPKFMLNNSKDKKKQIIIQQYNNIKRNQNVINVKADYMTMAQEYFKRAIGTSIFFGIISFCNYIVTYKDIKKDFLNIFSFFNFNVVIIVIFVLIFALYVLVIRLFSKLKKL